MLSSTTTLLTTFSLLILSISAAPQAPARVAPSCPGTLTKYINLPDDSNRMLDVFRLNGYCSKPDVGAYCDVDKSIKFAGPIGDYEKLCTPMNCACA